MSVSSRVRKTPRSRAKANACARSDGLGPPANRSTSARSRSRLRIPAAFGAFRSSGMVYS